MRKIAMRCTQEQFKSIKDRIKCEINDAQFNFKLFPYLTNNYCAGNSIGLGTHDESFIGINTEVYETFDAEIFLRACDSWEEEVQYEVFACGRWIDAEYKVRVKPQPDYSKEIEALQLKAKENGMKCIINFEKI